METGEDVDLLPGACNYSLSLLAWYLDVAINCIFKTSFIKVRKLRMAMLAITFFNVVILRSQVNLSRYLTR